MARLASQERLGYFPTPQVVVDLIKSCLGRSGDGKIRIYDPCAGTGDAVAQIANHLQAESFGVELDKKRAEQAKKSLGKVIQGDSLRVSVRSGSMSCLFLNPPYDYYEGARLENKFIAHTGPSLQTGGVLVLIISIRSLNQMMRRYLASWFSDLRLTLFPKKEFERFKQIVIFGRKKKEAVLNKEALKDLDEASAQLFRDYVPWLELTPGCCRYEVPPASLPEKFFHFRNLEMTGEEMIGELAEDGFEHEVFDLVVKRNGNVRIRPAAPLRKGHLAILVASGMTDGLVEKDGKRLLIKGTVRKEKVKTVETDENVQTITERDVLKIEIVGLDLRSGEIFSIQ
jgi:hypothetical protein